MSGLSEFVDHILDMLEPLGAVRARRMFGGYGIYRGDVMFALVADEILYFKADDGNRRDFEEKHLEPFTYSRAGKTFAMSYYEAPPDALEDSEALCRWARAASEAAERSANKPAGTRVQRPRKGRSGR